MFPSLSVWIAGFSIQKINFCERIESLAMSAVGSCIKISSPLPWPLQTKDGPVIVHGKKDYWEYILSLEKCKTWDRLQKSYYCRLINDGDQIYLPGCRPVRLS